MIYKETGWQAYLIDFGKHRHFGTMQNTKSQADHLQVLTTSGGADVARFRADIEGDGLLQPGHEEMGAFVDDLIRDTA